jgi:2-dehydro-3-deoxyphosphogluconate aldolase / (4S)-4-hydroxy-2-oxoglutarate aldolase
MSTTSTMRPGLGPLEPVLESGVIAVVRHSTALPLRGVARALAAGGVGAVEVTLTTPGAIDTIGELVADEGLGRCLVGAGTVLDTAAARSVIDAGARFVVSPTLEPAVIRACRDRDVPCIPGAFTPTELLAAWRSGAELVKLFPASAVGPGYVRDVLAPLPFLRLIPSGGVSLENVGDWIRAGAAAVSLGGGLVTPALLAPDRAAELTARARALVTRVAEARA